MPAALSLTDDPTFLSLFVIPPDSAPALVDDSLAVLPVDEPNPLLPADPDPLALKPDSVPFV